MQVGQSFKDVPTPTELGTLFGASFVNPRTPPTITLDGQTLQIYELSYHTRGARRVGSNLCITVGRPAERHEDMPPCARLTIVFEAHDEDGGEYDEGGWPAKAGYYVATVGEVDPGFAPDKS
jgi:hypothetical protein